MKKLVLLCSIVLGSAFALQAQPTSSGNIDPNAPVLSLDKTEYNFGTIKQGEVATYTLSFKNTGKSPLLITHIQTPCGCTTPVWPKDPINPGKAAKIEISFNSAGKMGDQTKVLQIQSNNKDGDVAFTLKGKVEAKPADAPALPAKTGGPVEKGGN
ncbi:MAG: hypothetical protein FD123_3681 [Bacteroidetes bacterium]|nr:MAG: hypothetical protein FD123_3681 [Bacteroidota bacterium]